MNRTKEATVVGHIRKYLSSLPNCHFEKRWGGPYSRAGLPDISGCIKGRSFQLEVKRPGGKPTNLQLYELERWRNAGAVAAVVYSVDEVRDLFGREGLVT